MALVTGLETDLVSSLISDSKSTSSFSPKSVALIPTISKLSLSTLSELSLNSLYLSFSLGAAIVSVFFSLVVIVLLLSSFNSLCLEPDQCICGSFQGGQFVEVLLIFRTYSS
ncbi:hypothetical protein RJT34_17169 [Clitoria ternatea]|uniref:Uncharacterized protein n=1 Tax=Clitoria ternatea TaxID=43366 RepID=A0AAN9J8G2_CLITE